MKRTIQIEIATPAGECTPTIYLPKEIIGNGFRFAFATEPDQPEPWARWRATADGDGFWKVSTSGKTQEDAECFIREDDEAYAFGNYFRTQALAQRHAKRLRSMVPTCAMPKVGDTYWSVSIVNVYYAGTWKDGEVHHARYHKGLVFLTKESAEAWIAEFGDVWTTRVDGEGE